MREEQKYPNPQSYGMKEVVKKKEVEAYSLLAKTPCPVWTEQVLGDTAMGGEKNMME